MRRSSLQHRLVPCVGALKAVVARLRFLLGAGRYRPERAYMRGARDMRRQRGPGA